MIKDTMEYLYEDKGLEYYLLSEIGFTHKKYAAQHKLYQLFGKSASSTYCEIFHKNLYDNHLIEQVWIFDGEKPVGLSLGVHFENFQNLSHQEKILGEILGQIHLYVSPEYRSRGMARHSTAILEEGFLKYQVAQKNSFIIMQDDALHCKNALHELIAIPNNYKEEMTFVMKEIVRYKMRSMREAKPHILEIK